MLVAGIGAHVNAHFLYYHEGGGGRPPCRPLPEVQAGSGPPPQRHPFPEYHRQHAGRGGGRDRREDHQDNVGRLTPAVEYKVNNKKKEIQLTNIKLQ